MRRFTLLLLLLIPLFCFGQKPRSDAKEERIGKSLNELHEEGLISDEELNSTRSPENHLVNGERDECFDAYIPVDPSYIPVPRNDDGSLYIPNMGFTFSFCGSSYTDCYINTNGNISFTQGVAQYSPDGFPYPIPMIAPFWADVDTRNLSCGQAWYQLFGNYMIVSWEDVGWYNQQCVPLNTFQVIISDGTAGIIGVGNNIQFRYGDMEWTTGQASGGGPFGGFPATVGYNSGDNVNFEQIGRFNEDNANYDGPFGANDGVHWLDYKCFVFDAGGAGPLNLSCIDIERSLEANCAVSITAEDVSEVSIDGCATVDVSIDISSFGCDDIGQNFVTVTATSGNTTETCQAIVTITDGLCASLNISPAGPMCETDFPTTLTASQPGGTWSPNAPGGVFNPTNNGPGLHTVTYTHPNACPTTAETQIQVFAAPDVIITPDPAEFCQDQGSLPLFATGSGGNGIYTYNWTTPTGPQSGSPIDAVLPGLYTVTISDGNGCTDVAFTNVVVHPPPQPQIIDPGPICESTTIVTLQADPPGGIWSGSIISPQGDIYPIQEGAGTYSVTYNYTDGFGCTGSDNIMINIVATPQAFADNGGPYCEDDFIQLFGNTDVNGVNTSYQWSGPNNYSSTQQNPTDATVGGIYVLQVTVDGCPSENDFTEVVVTETPDAIALNGGPYCPGNPIQLFGSTSSNGAIITYQWSGPNGYFSFEQNPLDATLDGTYELVVTVDGCPSEIAFTDVLLNDPPEALALNGGPYCEGNFIELFGQVNTGGNTVIYTWSGPNNYQSFEQNPNDAFEPGTYELVVDVDGCLSEVETTEVIINDMPQPVITGEDVFCEDASVFLDAGNGYIDYVWSEPGGNQILEVTASGTYFVTVTDINGCTGTDEFTVTQNDNPEPVITGEDTFCEGTSATLDAGGPFNEYFWTGGGTGQTLDVNQPGTYEVTVTNGAGCTGTDSFTIIQNDNPQPDITGDLDFCDGQNTVLDAGVFDSYLWSDNTNNQTLLVDATNTYSVTVTDSNGCTGVDQVEVVANPNPEPTILGDDAFCEGESSILDAGIFDSYEWSVGGTSQTVEVSVSGTVGVTVTDSNGCTGEDDININVNPNPEPTIAGSTTFCSGNSTTLDAGGPYSTYEWSTGSNEQTIEVSTSGSFMVTVTNANGCTGIAQVDITESSELNPVISGDTEYCFGSSTILDAGAGFNTYLWTGGSVEQTLDVNTPGDYSVTVTDASGCTGETTVSISENQLPDVAITGNDPFCSGSSITLDAGGNFDEYIWSTSSLNQTISVSTGGVYSVTVTDANGCTNMAEVTAIENDNPEPDITGDDAFCDGNSSTLDAGSGYDTYAWSANNGSGQTLDVSTGGTYFVTVTDTNGCTGIDQFTVTVNPLPEPEITGTLDFCEGLNTILTASAGYDIYEWSNGPGTTETTVDQPGDYTVTVTTVEGCTGETTVSVTENPNPEPSISGSSTFCTGTSTLLDAGAGYETYQWTGGTANQTINVSVEGTYSVIVTDENGCTGEDQLFVEESDNLNPVIVGNLTLCDGEISTLDAGSGFDSYSWSTTANTQTIDVSTNGTYTVTVTDANGCTGESSAQLIVNDNPSITITGNDTFCEGDNSVLDAGGGFDIYSWDDGTTVQTLTVTTSGAYSVTVTDENGCTDEDEIVITVNPNPAPDITGPSSFCSGNSATLDGGGGFDTYLWNNGSQTQTITVNSGNTWALTVTDVNGCTGEDAMDVTENSSLTPVIIGDLEFCEGSSTTLDAGSGYETYEWSNGETTQTIEVTQSGSFGVIVTDTDGCSGSDNVTATLNPNPDPVIGGSTSYCIGSQTILDAGPGYDSYSWSTGDNTQSVTVSSPGVITVDVIDNNGCAGSATVNVEESTSLNPVIAGLTAFCEDGNTTLDAGSGFDSYLWSTGSDQQTINVDVPDDYSVTVADSQGCTGETTVSVTEVLPPSAELEPNAELCNTEAGGSVVNLYDLVISGDMNGTWEDADNSGAVGLFDNLNFNGISAGVYNFIYTTSSAVAPCQEVAYPVTVTVLDCACPSVSFTNADPLCNASETLDVSSIANTSEPGNWTIVQTPAGSSPAALNGTLFDATGADPGDYMLQFELINQPPPGCESTFFTNIEVDAEVSAGQVEQPLSYCFEDSEIVGLSDLITGEDAGGIWSETSANPSQGGAFDDTNGTFETTTQVPGTYTFAYLVSSGGACPDQTSEVSVIINELPVAMVGGTVELNCNDPMNSLDAAGSSTGPDFTIDWTGPGIVMDGNETSLSPTINQPGAYLLTITNDQTGCSATAQAEVTSNEVFPNAFAGEDDAITCNEQSVNLQAQGDVGSGYEIIWQGPDINASNMNEISPEVSTPGIYVLVINDINNGCSSAPDTVIVLDETDEPDVFINTPSVEITCADPAVALAGGSTTPDVSYQWLDPNGIEVGNTEEITGITSTGVYTLIITDNANGCTAMETALISASDDVPQADAGLPGLINCYNGEAILDGSASENGTNITYSWTGPPGGINGPANELTVLVDLPGTYTITVLNMDNGCSSTASVLVNEDTQAPDAQIANPEQLDCSVNEVSLDGSGSSSGNIFTYTWTNSQGAEISNTLQALASEAGEYNLTVFNTDNGCSTTITTTVSNNDNVLSSALILVYELDCHNDTDAAISVYEPIGGTPPYLYSFNGEPYDGNSFYTELPAGSYEIAMEDANGCYWDTTIVIANPAQVDLDLGPDIELEWGDSARIDAQVNIPLNRIDTILWTPDHVINCADGPFCLEGVVNTFNTVSLSATLVDINGCKDTDDLMIHMNKDRGVYIPTAFSPNDDGENDKFMIFADSKDVVEIHKFLIFNRWGEILYEGRGFQPNDPDYGWDGKLRGEYLNPGVFVYLAEVEFIDGHIEMYTGDVTLLK